MLDGERIIENLGLHPVVFKQASIKPEPGWHSLEVLFFQKKGGAGAELEISPPANQSLTPVNPGFDLYKLWHLDRKVEWSGNWGHLLMWSALLLFVLCLLPHPSGWDSRITVWLRARWPWLVALGAVGILLIIDLDGYPGLHGDEGMMGDFAFTHHWYGIDHVALATYSNSNSIVFPIRQLLKLFPLTTELIRMVSVVLNLAALFFCVRFLERTVSKQAAWLGFLIIGSSVWYLTLSRVCLEVAAYGPLLLGIALWALSLARERWWGLPVFSTVLALAIDIHTVMAPLVAGLWAMLIWLQRRTWYKNWRFWLSAAIFMAIFIKHPLNYLEGHYGKGPVSGFSLIRPLKVVWYSLYDMLPGVLGGDMVLTLFRGEPWFSLSLVTLAAFALAAVYWLKKGVRSESGEISMGLVIASVTCLLGFSLILPALRIRYYEGLVLILCLWLAIVGAEMIREKGFLRKAALVGAAVFAFAGLCTFFINGPFTKITSLKQIYMPAAGTDPVEVLWETTLHYLDTRELYQKTIEINRPIRIPNIPMAGAVFFHEREDIRGRHGYQFSSYRHQITDELTLFYRMRDNTAWKNILPVRDKLEKRLGRNVRQYDLGPDLDRFFVLYERLKPKTSP